MEQPPRQDTRVVAPVALLLEIDGVSEPCFTRNISLGGMFVVTPRRAEEGGRVRVSIIREGEKLETSARVVTKSDDGLGLRFINPEPAFSQGLAALIAEILKNEERGRVDHETHTQVAWSRIPDGKSWNWWRKGMKRAELVSISHDGAALKCRSRPQVGETVLIFLRGDESDDENLTCQGEVVRHLVGGFAVKLIAPSIPFRRAVSVLRRRATVG